MKVEDSANSSKQSRLNDASSLPNDSISSSVTHTCNNSMTIIPPIHIQNYSPSSNLHNNSFSFSDNNTFNNPLNLYTSYDLSAYYTTGKNLDLDNSNFTNLASSYKLYHPVWNYSKNSSEPSENHLQRKNANTQSLEEKDDHNNSTDFIKLDLNSTNLPHTLHIRNYQSLNNNNEESPPSREDVNNQTSHFLNNNLSQDAADIQMANILCNSKCSPQHDTHGRPEPIYKFFNHDQYQSHGSLKLLGLTQTHNYQFRTLPINQYNTQLDQIQQHQQHHNQLDHSSSSLFNGPDNNNTNPYLSQVKFSPSTLYDSTHSTPPSHLVGSMICGNNSMTVSQYLISLGNTDSKNQNDLCYSTTYTKQLMNSPTDEIHTNQNPPGTISDKTSSKFPTHLNNHNELFIHHPINHGYFSNNSVVDPSNYLVQAPNLISHQYTPIDPLYFLNQGSSYNARQPIFNASNVYETSNSKSLLKASPCTTSIDSTNLKDSTDLLQNLSQINCKDREFRTYSQPINSHVPNAEGFENTTSSNSGSQSIVETFSEQPSNHKHFLKGLNSDFENLQKTPSRQKPAHLEEMKKTPSQNKIISKISSKFSVAKSELPTPTQTGSLRKLSTSYDENNKFNLLNSNGSSNFTPLISSLKKKTSRPKSKPLAKGYSLNKVQQSKNITSQSDNHLSTNNNNINDLNSYFSPPKQALDVKNNTTISLQRQFHKSSPPVTIVPSRSNSKNHFIDQQATHACSHLAAYSSTYLPSDNHHKLDLTQKFTSSSDPHTLPPNTYSDRYFEQFDHLPLQPILIGSTIVNKKILPPTTQSDYSSPSQPTSNLITSSSQLPRFPSTITSTSINTSPIKGIYYDSHKRLWRVQWWVEKGSKRISRSFAETDNGFWTAKAKAALWSISEESRKLLNTDHKGLSESLQPLLEDPHITTCALEDYYLQERQLKKAAQKKSNKFCIMSRKKMLDIPLAQVFCIIQSYKSRKSTLQCSGANLITSDCYDDCQNIFNGPKVNNPCEFDLLTNFSSGFHPITDENYSKSPNFNVLESNNSPVLDPSRASTLPLFCSPNSTLYSPDKTYLQHNSEIWSFPNPTSDLHYKSLHHFSTSNMSNFSPSQSISNGHSNFSNNVSNPTKSDSFQDSLKTNPDQKGKSSYHYAKRISNSSISTCD